ncbi:MAG TPA: GGDEF domain-containing protein [Actinomycetota bacterium]
MTRVGGLVLIAGGLLGTVVTVIAEGSRLRIPIALGLSGATLLLALGYLAAGERVPEHVLHAGPPIGSLLVASMIYVGGGGVTSAALAMPYVWIAMYAGYFHSARYMAGVVALGAAGHAVALLALGGPRSWPPIWLYAAATSAVVGAMVHYLVVRLRDLAATDALTGLPNRREWDELLSSHLRFAGRLGYRICVAMLDVDDLKGFNDSRGHAAGDEALRSIARAGRTVLRGTDVLARVGGDEFGLLLPTCDPEGASEIMGRLRHAIAADVTVSVGVAVWDGDEGADALMLRADVALYRAKRMGRDRVELAEVRPGREARALST